MEQELHEYSLPNKSIVYILEKVKMEDTSILKTSNVSRDATAYAQSDLLMAVENQENEELYSGT